MSKDITFKWNVGDVVFGRLIVDRYVSNNHVGKAVAMYLYRYPHENPSIKPLSCSQATLLRKYYYSLK